LLKGVSETMLMSRAVRSPLVWRSACDHCDKKWEKRSGDTRERDRMERSDRWWQQ